MNKVLDNLDKQSLEIIRHIGDLTRSKNMKAYLVGGPVRDLILKRKNMDMDVSIEGRAIPLAQAFAKAQGGRILTYPAFGTATVTLPGGRCVDFATARKERYVRPGAFPAVEFATIKDDLFRRDFTINAIAVRADRGGAVVDPFGGLKDIKAKKLRVLHDKSFIDDPTRILRVARFAGRFGFKLDKATLKLLRFAIAGGALETIKTQRYAKEYNKILGEENPKPALELLRSWGVMNMEGYYAAH